MRADSPGFVIRKAAPAERVRLREIFRDAVLAAGPRTGTHASLTAYPGLSDAGFAVVAREEYENRGRMFSRARIRKALR